MLFAVFGMRAVQFVPMLNIWMVRFAPTLAQWHAAGYLRRQHIITDFEQELRAWLSNNIIHDYQIIFSIPMNRRVEFDREDDALLCYLRFC